MTTLILGASGIIGRAHLQALACNPDATVIAASRKPEANLPANIIPYPVDLFEQDAADPAPLADVTHAVYCAYIERLGGFEAQNGPNGELFAGAIRLIERCCPKLRHMTLLQGNKAYGSHLGPFKTPAKETDPRIPEGHFYYDQHDMMAQAGERLGFDWTILRPHVVIGPSTNSPMNLMAVLGAYASIQKAKGEPLAFPGPDAAFRAIYQASDVDLLSKSIKWAGEAQIAAGEIYNITNGDYFRWENVWDDIAALFDMNPAPPADIKLTETMADAGPIWSALAAEHGLKTPDLSFVSWGFADYVFGTTWDVMSDATKLRRHGLVEFVDSEQMLQDRLTELRTLKIIP
ncbi:MAG: NAD-dependent epimerase/dehydratase family protein [Pseudomonadota bacterium]